MASLIRKNRLEFSGSKQVLVPKQGTLFQAVVDHDVLIQEVIHYYLVSYIPLLPRRFCIPMNSLVLSPHSNGVVFSKHQYHTMSQCLYIPSVTPLWSKNSLTYHYGLPIRNSQGTSHLYLPEYQLLDPSMRSDHPKFQNIPISFPINRLINVDQS